MIDTTKPSRALDAAVAKVMGCGTIYRTSRDGWIEWDGVEAQEYLAYSVGKERILIPHYSRPTTVDDTPAVLSMILWLMERNIVLLERIQGKTLVDLTNAGPEVDSEAVEGEPLQALALALCQVVVRVGGTS